LRSEDEDVDVALGKLMEFLQGRRRAKDEAEDKNTA
jgi:hypothetical protein